MLVLLQVQLPLQPQTLVGLPRVPLRPQNPRLQPAPLRVQLHLPDHNHENLLRHLCSDRCQWLRKGSLQRSTLHHRVLQLQAQSDM